MFVQLCRCRTTSVHLFSLLTQVCFLTGLVQKCEFYICCQLHEVVRRITIFNEIKNKVHISFSFLFLAWGIEGLLVIKLQEGMYSAIIPPQPAIVWFYSTNSIPILAEIGKMHSFPMIQVTCPSKKLLVLSQPCIECSYPKVPPALAIAFLQVGKYDCSEVPRRGPCYFICPLSKLTSFPTPVPSPKDNTHHLDHYSSQPRSQ